MLERALLPAAPLILHTVPCGITRKLAQSLQDTSAQSLQKVQHLNTATDYSCGHVSNAQQKCFAGSPGSSNSSVGAASNSPRSPVAVYSPTAAAAAAAAAGIHGHSLYSFSQTVDINQNMYPSYHYQHESVPGWQQGFIQGVGYGQPMRAYRSAYSHQGKCILQFLSPKELSSHTLS